MSENLHARAEKLIAQERVEGISQAERDWLAAHLRECPACAQVAQQTNDALRALRGVAIPLPRGLAAAHAIPRAIARAGIARARTQAPSPLDYVRDVLGSRHRHRALRLASDRMDRSSAPALHCSSWNLALVFGGRFPPCLRRPSWFSKTSGKRTNAIGPAARVGCKKLSEE